MIRAEGGYEKSMKDIGWISVEKSLPPIGEEVIVLTNEMNGHTLSDASHLCFAHRPDPKVAVCYDGWNIPGVRYWMNCPELPEEIESNRPNSSDSSLETEMINYWGRIPDDKDLIDTARHFALWEKEQMLKEAVEGEVVKTFPDGVSSIHYLAPAGIGEMAYFCVLKGLNIGQKVRIVTIKAGIAEKFGWYNRQDKEDER